MITQRPQVVQVNVIRLDRLQISDTRTPSVAGSEKWVTLALFVCMLASGILGEWLAHGQQRVQTVRPADQQAGLQSARSPQRNVGPVHLAKQLRDRIRPSHI
jgi:hypothetical protein